MLLANILFTVGVCHNIQKIDNLINEYTMQQCSSFMQELKFCKDKHQLSEEMVNCCYFSTEREVFKACEDRTLSYTECRAVKQKLKDREIGDAIEMMVNKICKPQIHIPEKQVDTPAEQPKEAVAEKPKETPTEQTNETTSETQGDNQTKEL